MNAVEQRRHTSVTSELGSRLDTIEPVVLRLMHDHDALIASLKALKGTAATTIEKLEALNEIVRQRGLLLTAHFAATIQEAHAPLTFWQHLRWLFLGR